MTDSMRRLARRDMSVGIAGLDRRDELGDMAGAVQVFRDSMVEADRLGVEQALGRKQSEQRAEHLGRLVEGFEQQAGSLVGMLAAASTELEATAHAMTRSAGDTSQQADSVAGAAEQAGEGARTVAAAAAELSASIVEISRRVAESATITAKAVTRRGAPTASCAPWPKVRTRSGMSSA